MNARFECLTSYVGSFKLYPYCSHWMDISINREHFMDYVPDQGLENVGVCFPIEPNRVTALSLQNNRLIHYTTPFSMTPPTH